MILHQNHWQLVFRRWSRKFELSVVLLLNYCHSFAKLDALEAPTVMTMIDALATAVYFSYAIVRIDEKLFKLIRG